MRIALMPSNYAPAVGGVEVLTARLARQLVLRGHDVEVWAPRSDGDDLKPVETIDGITVRRFVFAMPRAHVGTMLRLPAAMLATVRELRAAARAFKPTHLHVQCFSANGLYATMVGRLTRTPLIVTLQGETVMDDNDIYDRSTTLRMALRWGLRSAAAVTGCSQFTLDDAHRRFGLKPAKASVIFNGVDLDESEPGPVTSTFHPPYENYVFAMGRVVPKKGFDLLLNAFSRVAEKVPSAELVIGGDGNQRDTLVAQAAAAGLADRVHFPGRLSRAQVSAYMQQASVFVMPSRVEPFGIVILEAWRAQTAVIASSHGGPPEFVEDGVSGHVVAPEDADRLGEALVLLLDDEDARQAMAARGLAAVQNFTWSRLCVDYERLYALP